MRLNHLESEVEKFMIDTKRDNYPAFVFVGCAYWTKILGLFQAASQYAPQTHISSPGYSSVKYFFAWGVAEIICVQEPADFVMFGDNRYEYDNYCLEKAVWSDEC